MDKNILSVNLTPNMFYWIVSYLLTFEPNNEKQSFVVLFFVLQFCCLATISILKNTYLAY